MSFPQFDDGLPNFWETGTHAGDPDSQEIPQVPTQKMPLTSEPTTNLLNYDSGSKKGKPVSGLQSPGNIDLNHRPVITNDPSRGWGKDNKSTIFSMTVPVDKEGNPVEWEDKNISGYALVPSIADGKFLTPDGQIPAKGNKKALAKLEKEAAKHYSKTREHLGVFKTAEDAERYAGETHAYGPDGTNKKVYHPSGGK